MGKDMVYVYALDVSEFPDPRGNEQVMKGIWPERKVKILRYLKEQDRKLSLGAGILIRDLLPKYGDSQSNIYTTKIGKLCGKSIQFNISHSYPFVVCAISSLGVGCDIEQIKMAPIDVAVRCFSKRELDYLHQLPAGDERNRGFYRIWTMKESYVKMTGEGMRVPFNEFAMDLDGDIVRVIRNNQIEICFVKEYVLPGYQIAVCARETEFADEIEIYPY